MARAIPGRKAVGPHGGNAPGPRAALKSVTGGRAAMAMDAREPDAALHHRLRLGIVSALAGTPSLTFNELKAILQTTDGNLSVHARRLEEAGYVLCTKRFEERRPRTEYRLAASGRRALHRYLDHMEALIQSTRDNLRG